MNTVNSKLLLLGGALWLASFACTPAPVAPKAEAPAPAVVAPAPAMVAPAPAMVAPASPGPARAAKLVFVGKEHACDCTRKAIDASWTALQEVLGPNPTLPVVQLQSDTEEALVEPYRQQKAYVALPALYLVDGAEKVLEVLQGEVTVEQVRALLATPSPAPAPRAP